MPQYLELISEYEDLTQVSSNHSTGEYLAYFESYKAVCNFIFGLEEEVLKRGWDLRFRFVLSKDLKASHALLIQRKRSQPRIQVLIDKDPIGLETLFQVWEGLITQVPQKHKKLFFDMLHESSNKLLAETHRKHRTHIWKYRVRLNVDKTIQLKQVIENTCSFLDLNEVSGT